MKRKTLTGTEVKADSDSGEVVAVFSTFNVIDHDGDVTLPGAFDDGAPVRISAYNHASWGPALPVGRGKIRVEDDRALMEGKFFLNTTHGRDTFETVKQMADLGEWSYGFDIVQAHDGEQEGRPVQYLEKLKVHEVSPVLLGAGIGTATLSAKSLDDMTDEECIDQLLKSWRVLQKRGLVLPQEVADHVRKADRDAAEVMKTRGTLELIAAAHGININGGEH